MHGCAAITRYETALICVADAALGEHVRARLNEHGIDLNRVRLIEVEYDDTWLRDSGPIRKRARSETSGSRAAFSSTVSPLASEAAISSTWVAPTDTLGNTYRLPVRRPFVLAMT